MSGEMTIFESCSVDYDADDVTSLLKCIADKNDVARADLQSGLDTFYLLWAGALVYFMQTGFAMLCAGSIRSKNVSNVILWNLLDSAGGGLAFFVCGYAFAYGGDDGDGGKTFLGTKNFFLMDEDEGSYQDFFFQFAFACAVSSIVAGTIAERTQMKAYLMYSTFLVGFVYPVAAHAYWSPNGFLSAGAKDQLFGAGVIDLAGSGPVHMTGGVTALIAAIILGPRRGRFYDAQTGQPLEEAYNFPPHSVALQFLGTFCLWFGWYGFNPGSTLGIGTESLGDVASLVAVNTTLAACAGAISAMFTSTFLDKMKTGIATYDVTYTMNGCLTGLVAITAGCATVSPWAAVVIGIFSGWFYLLGSYLLVKFRIDDAVDAIPVHMVGGAWGVIATGLFSSATRLKLAFDQDEHIGWFYEFNRGSGNFTMLGAQLVGVAFIIIWISVTMIPFFMFLRVMGWFRIDQLEEEVGMDLSIHKGQAYSINTPDQDKVDELNKSKSNSNYKLRGTNDNNDIQNVEEGKEVSPPDQSRHSAISIGSREA